LRGVARQNIGKCSAARDDESNQIEGEESSLSRRKDPIGYFLEPTLEYALDYNSTMEPPVTPSPTNEVTESTLVAVYTTPVEDSIESTIPTVAGYPVCVPTNQDMCLYHVNSPPTPPMIVSVSKEFDEEAITDSPDKLVEPDRVQTSNIPLDPFVVLDSSMSKINDPTQLLLQIFFRPMPMPRQQTIEILPDSSTIKRRLCNGKDNDDTKRKSHEDEKSHQADKDKKSHQDNRAQTRSSARTICASHDEKSPHRTSPLDTSRKSNRENSKLVETASTQEKYDLPSSRTRMDPFKREDWIPGAMAIEGPRFSNDEVVEERTCAIPGEHTGPTDGGVYEK